MRKILAEYEAEYGAISTDDLERMVDFVEKHPLNRGKKTLDDEVSRIRRIPWKRVDFTLFMVPKAYFLCIW